MNEIKGVIGPDGVVHTAEEIEAWPKTGVIIFDFQSEQAHVSAVDVRAEMIITEESVDARLTPEGIAAASARLEERRKAIIGSTQGIDLQSATYVTLSKQFMHRVKVSLAQNRAKLYQYHRAMRQPFANIQGVKRGRKVRKANQSR